MQTKSSGLLLGNSIPADLFEYLGILGKGMTMDINEDFSKCSTAPAASKPLGLVPVQRVKQIMSNRMGY